MNSIEVGEFSFKGQEYAEVEDAVRSILRANGLKFKSISSGEAKLVGEDRISFPVAFTDSFKDAEEAEFILVMDEEGKMRPEKSGFTEL